MKHTLKNKMGVSQDILKTLEDEPRQSPEMIKTNLEIQGKKYSISSIKSALHYMGPKDLYLVGKVARGLYEITDLGKTVLHHPDQSSGRTKQ